ncbi:MAG: histidine phosphatase family protein [Planctomycetaceae bacterium]
MSRIILIRPGCTEFDEQQRLPGTLDLPLSTKGEQEVCRLLTDLEQTHIDLLYTSPSEPARSTAARLGAARSIPVKEVENLHNVNVGLWQGLQLEEVRRKHPRVFKQWQESSEAICPPDGETLAEAIERVRKALEKPLKKKGQLAIVAADPLAAIIAAVVRGSSPECYGTLARGCCGSWEALDDAPSQKVNGAATKHMADARSN